MLHNWTIGWILATFYRHPFTVLRTRVYGIVVELFLCAISSVTQHVSSSSTEFAFVV